MSLTYNPDAFCHINNQPKRDKKRLQEKAEWLWIHRHDINHLPLKGNLSGYYKRPVGQYRLIYTYDEDVDEIYICWAGLRRDIYNIPPKIV